MNKYKNENWERKINIRKEELKKTLQFHMKWNCPKAVNTAFKCLEGHLRGYAEWKLRQVRYEREDKERGYCNK